MTFDDLLHRRAGKCMFVRLIHKPRHLSRSMLETGSGRKQKINFTLLTFVVVPGTKPWHASLSQAGCLALPVASATIHCQLSLLSLLPLCSILVSLVFVAFITLTAAQTPHDHLPAVQTSALLAVYPRNIAVPPPSKRPFAESYCYTRQQIS